MKNLLYTLLIFTLGILFILFQYITHPNFVKNKIKKIDTIEGVCNMDTLNYIIIGSKIDLEWLKLSKKTYIKRSKQF